MKNFINRNGEITKVAPETVIEIDECFTGRLNTLYVVFVLKGDDRQLIGMERFNEPPTKGNILWAIVKHDGEYAQVQTIYEPDLDC